MMFLLNRIVLSALLLGSATAFQSPPCQSTSVTTTSLGMTEESSDHNRRSVLLSPLIAAAGTFALANPSNANVYFDPAIYGDQELRASAVNTLKEAVRRSILQDPALAPAFYQLAILDGLSYDANTKDYGPDGRVVAAALNSKDSSEYTKNLQKASQVLIQACTNLKKMTSIGVADAVALGGAASVESIGGPFLNVQLGRTEVPKAQLSNLSPLDLGVLSGDVSNDKVVDAFHRSGLTDREMTAILGTLLTINTVQKNRSSDDWKKSMKPKFREAGKMGRASEFKRLTDEDIREMEEESTVEGDDGWYIAESFGSRDETFGAKVGDISEKTFNAYLKDLYTKGNNKKNKTKDIKEFGWIGEILTDKNNPSAEAWLGKYAGSYLNFNKDLLVAYNAMTQLGAEYTGGKYENLLKDRKRKTLNDDDLGLTFN